ncbi:hypothetical protein AZE42_07477 [Rhizopogon vesiculosus]|uniref:Uncharacterized protein n=1 Tax=Rhizopogon vesiculosus TaxID=180088 RepID=A0A1J8Q7N7_9AGAM|nr:hypothetical protein AZE42_07477 [Rhizopogon vesiculosus]
MSRGRTPDDLEDFASLGTPCHTDAWAYKLWEKSWLEGSIGITSHPVVRDESPISLDPPIPSSCWVMNACHSDEFALFRVSHVLHAKLSTILQLDSGGFLLFSEFGVHDFPASPFPPYDASTLAIIAPNILCLVDSNEDNYTPSYFIQSSTLSIIQFASPHRTRVHWMNKINFHSRTYYLPPFTLQEAIVARSLQNKRPSEHQLQHWFERYVPSARLAYHNAVNIEDYEKATMSQLSIRIKDPISLQALANEAALYMDDDLLQHIFVFLPFKHYSWFNCCIPTRYLCKKLIECCDLQNDEERRHCLYTFLLTRGLAAAAGYLMELLVHTLLPSRGSWPLLTLSVAKCKSKQHQQHWIVDTSTEDQWLVVGFKEQPVLHISPVNPNPLPDSPCGPPLRVKRYDTLISSELEDHCFYIPNSSNQPISCSFYYYTGHAYIFQCTADRKHTVSDQSLGMMKQLGVQKVVCIVVVPAGQEPKFNIKKTTAEKYEDLLGARYLLQLDSNILYNDWTTNELEALNIIVEPRDPVSFFGSALPNTTVDPILLNSLQCPPGTISKDNRLFFRYLEDATCRFPSVPLAESPVNDFTAFLLVVMDEEDYILLLVQEDKRYTGTSSDEVEPQLIAEAIAAFYENNRRRREVGICTVPSKVFAGIVMSGTTPIFYKIPITEELIDAISCAQHPPNQTVVDKLVPPVPHLHSYSSDGMIPLENRRIIIQCLEAFKQVRVLKWSFEDIICMVSIIQSASPHQSRVQVDWMNKINLHLRLCFLPSLTLQEAIIAYVLQFLRVFNMHG